MAPRPPRRALTVLFGAVPAAGVLLALAGWRDARFSTRRIERIMLAQGRTIADLVTESWSHGAEAYQLWQDETAARLHSWSTSWRSPPGTTTGWCSGRSPAARATRAAPRANRD